MYLPCFFKLKYVIVQLTILNVHTDHLIGMPVLSKAIYICHRIYHISLVDSLTITFIFYCSVVHSYVSYANSEDKTLKTGLNIMDYTGGRGED